MSDVKKKLLAEIDRKSKKIKDHRLAIEDGSKVKTYVINFINELDHYAAICNDKAVFQAITESSVATLESQITRIDCQATVDISWFATDGAPRVNGVLVKWGPTYIAKNKVDPQLYIDVNQLLLEDL